MAPIRACGPMATAARSFARERGVSRKGRYAPLPAGRNLTVPVLYGLRHGRGPRPAGVQGSHAERMMGPGCHTPNRVAIAHPRLAVRRIGGGIAKDARAHKGCPGILVVHATRVTPRGRRSARARGSPTSRGGRSRSTGSSCAPTSTHGRRSAETTRPSSSKSALCEPPRCSASSAAAGTSSLSIRLAGAAFATDFRGRRPGRVSVGRRVGTSLRDTASRGSVESRQAGRIPPTVATRHVDEILAGDLARQSAVDVLATRGLSPAATRAPRRPSGPPG